MNRSASRLDRSPMTSGFLIVNADDWGRDRVTTDRALDCLRAGTVSSVSGMVFMEDSERAAAIAGERRVDAGLHLNLTTPFSAPSCPPRLVQQQQRLGHYLRRHRLSQLMFHPGLRSTFAEVVAAQLHEFRRLYGVEPERVDGHHHMHLCANVLLAGLLPRGTMVRRSFSFRIGEKSLANIVYRRLVDRALSRRHRVVDHFFALAPLTPPSRLQRIFGLARRYVVEVETHPLATDEYRFLTGGELLARLRDVPLRPASRILRGELPREGRPA